MEDREWMYAGHPSMEGMTRDWVSKTEQFLDQAFAGETETGGILCPCKQCDNHSRKDKQTMGIHLGTHGFTPNYYW